MKKKNFEFYHTSGPEPHQFRRAAILKKYPEVRTLFGYDRKIAIVTFCIVLLQIFISVFMQQHFGSLESYSVLQGLSFFMLSYLIGGTLAHWSSMTIHEAAHNTAAKTVWGNRLVGLLANTIMIIPAAMSLRKHHPHHHVNMGVLSKDQDIPRQWIMQWVGNSRLRKFLWVTFYTLFAVVGTGRLGKQNKYEVLNLIYQIIVNSMVYFFIGPTAFAYLALSMFLGHSLNPISAHFIHEHYTIDPEQETYSYYGPINWITFNVGYHTEHHDFMNIPGTRLPELRKIAPEFYDSIVSHKSWLWIHFNFIFSEKLGHFSRVTRDHARATQSEQEKWKPKLLNLIETHRG